MLNIFSYLFNQNDLADKYITVLNKTKKIQKKENEIKKETINFEIKHSFTSSFEYLFYDFQIFIEFIEKFKDNMNLKYEWNFSDILDDLTFMYRFLKLWYYEVCWFYLRNMFEFWLDCFCLDKKISRKKDKLDRIIKKKKANEWPMKFITTEVYKLYEYLSKYYTHQHKSTDEYKFDEKKYLEIEGLSVVILITISNITANLIDGDLLFKYSKEKINAPIDWYFFYENYIWPLIWYYWRSWCTSRFENLLKYTNIQNIKFNNWDIWFDLYKRIYNYQDISNLNI